MSLKKINYFITFFLLILCIIMLKGCSSYILSDTSRNSMIEIGGEAYKVCAANICKEALNVNDNELLSRYFEEVLSDANKVMELFGGKFVAEYFLIDLNEDEYEDYLVRFEGAGYSGSGGDSVYILVGESAGVKEVFTGTIRFTTDNIEYGPFVVLKEKTEGMHDIIFTSYDRIFKYNNLEQRYE